MLGVNGMKDNDCNRVFGLLSEYLDRELAPATCEELEKHLRACPECVEFVRSLRRSVEICHRLGGCAPMPPPAQEAIASLRRAYAEMLARSRGRT